MNEILEHNPILYAGVIHVIQRGTACIYEDCPDGIFLIDQISMAAMIICRETQTGISWLEKHADKGYVSINTFDPAIFSWAKESFQFTNQMTCYQAVYEPDEPLPLRNILAFREAEESDFDQISSIYTKLSGDELLDVIRRRQLYLAYNNDVLVGFGGMHLEGAIGLLEILPPYRRKGYATELESFLINIVLQKGLTPFAQIETDNLKSAALHRKLNMTVSTEKTYWLF